MNVYNDCGSLMGILMDKKNFVFKEDIGYWNGRVRVKYKESLN